MHATLPRLIDSRFPAIRRRATTVLQVNLGYTCNQSCVHCHVNAGPQRTEQMDRATIDQVIELLPLLGVQTLDLTGGAPEINIHFRHLVQAARRVGVTVVDRCNLTILEEPGHEDLAEFLAAQAVQVTASLPCYSQENVDKQRGEGVFEASIRSLRKLNALGYAQPGTGLGLNLVYNPQGAVLPPPQAKLEADYKRLLGDNFGVIFDRLFALANMPIQRFGSTLISKGGFESYLALLRNSHQDANLEAVMCRDTLSVDWQGYLYDCDFNQMLGLNMPLASMSSGPRMHLRDLPGKSVAGQPIRVAEHCYGCTAGQGSSCGGALE